MNTLFSIADGRYLLADVIGEGGMATVYRGFDTRLGVWRAVKVLSPLYRTKKKLVGRFDSEARTMALLEHKNIVRVYDVGHVDGVAFIVMECIEGGALVDWIDTHGPMPTELALSVTIEVARAIEYAHSKGVIHRDIKPHNVLVHRDGRCRVTDFGIARLADDQLSVTKTGAVMGTWGYMAPEQRTDAKGVDERADVYALGATLYSLVTNSIPVDLFAADRDASLMKDVSGDLVGLIMKATQYRREERFDSVSSLRLALEETLQSSSSPPVQHPPLIQGTPVDPVSPTAEMIASAVPLTQHWSNEQQRLTGVRGQTLMPMEAQGIAYAPTMAPGEWGPLDSPRTERTPPKPPVPLTEIPLATEGTPEPSRAASRSWVWVLAVSPAVFGVVFGFVALFVLIPKLQTPTVSQPLVEALPPEAQVEPPPAVEADPKDTPEQVDEVPEKRQRRRRVSRDRGSEASTEPVVKPQCISVSKAPQDIRAGETVAFVVRLCVNTARPDVTLMYRAFGTNASWQRRKMTNLAGQYRFAVTITESYPQGMEYYIETKGASLGSASSPKFIPNHH